MTDTPTVPSSYMIYYKFVQCSHCGHTSRESQFFAVSYIKSRVNGRPERHLVPTNAPLYNLKVEKHLLGCYKVPYCQACDVIDLSHLPPPPSEAALHDLPEPALKTARVKPTTPPRRKPTIEELA